MSLILSSVVQLIPIPTGYTVTTTVHEQDRQGNITSVQTDYTVYNSSAALEHDHTPRHVDVYA